MPEASFSHSSGSDLAHLYSPPHGVGVTKQGRNLVLVEPDLSFLPDRAFMLTEAEYRVTTVRDIRELCPLSSRSTYSFALLSELLGAPALDSAARFVRTEWPAARILFLGNAQRMLDDHLYDERIELSCKSHELLKPSQHSIGRT